MHRSNPSRGRVLFEVLCALGLSASFAGAWLQTHATALLGAAGVAALYGLFHLFDLRQPRPAVAEPQRIDFEPKTSEIIVPMVAVEAQPAVECVLEEEEAAAQEKSRAGSGRRSGGSRKGSGRRAKAPKAEKPAEPVPVEEVEVPWPMAEEPQLAEAAPVEEEEFVFPHDEGSVQPHIQPLFEPEPYVRMPRQGFGRRGRI